MDTLVLIGVALLVYFSPSIIARMRHHHNVLAIFMLNLLLGWTFLGWCGALIWACTDPRR
jgi:ABC-type transport system involved in cytochrome c biogenesis permease component